MANELIKSKALKDIVQRDEVKNRLKEIMGQRAPQFAAALVQIVSQSWQLSKCEPNSVIGAALTAAALDLSIDPNLGQAHIVPYGEKAQFQIGYAGFAQLAQRSGQYKNLGWKVVHKGELESYDELSGEMTLNSNHPNEPVIGYASKFKLINGFERAEYWTAEQIEAHALRYSKAYRAARGDKAKEATCLWVTSRDRMALKTVLKSLLKIWGPKSIQMQQALKVDDGAIIDADTGEVAYVDNPGSEPSKPVFDGPAATQAPAEPVMEAEVVKDTPPPAGKAEKPEVAKPKAAKAKPTLVEEPLTMLDKVKQLIKDAGMQEKQFVDFMNEIGSTEDAKTLDQIAEESPEVLDMLHGQFADIANRIKNP
jgi:recombination protein RecT